MTTYRCTFSAIGALSVNVTADDEAAAWDAATDKLFALLDAAGIGYEFQAREQDGAVETEVAGLTFLEAVDAASRRRTENATIARPSGPEFTVDHLGQVTMRNNCLYLGDVLEFADWSAESVDGIAIGERYRFDYPATLKTLPDYTAHAGQIVTVRRQLTREEAAQEECAMFEVEAEDGWIGHADAGELGALDGESGL